MEGGSVLSLDEQLAAVSKAMDRAIGASVLSADDEAILAGLAKSIELRNKADALAEKFALSAERSMAVHRNGARNVANWVGARTSAPAKSARFDMRMALWLEEFADFQAAHQAGLLGRDHLRLLRHADTYITHFALLRDQAEIADMATSLLFEEFEIAIQYWINAADPDGQIPREQERSNEFSITERPDGSISFKGQLDPLLGKAVNTAVTAELDKVRDADQAEDRVRSQRARRAQALANLTAKGALREDGTMPLPLVSVVMSQSVAEALTNGEVPDISATDVDGRCEFIDGTPLHPAFAAKLLPNAILRRIVLDADARAIDVSVNTRLFPGWMKQVALVQTRGRCTEAGCDAPINWIEADHRHPHSKGGATSLRNLDPLCGPSNRAKRDSLPPDRSDKPDEPAA